jgi:hypothetical protein
MSIEIISDLKPVNDAPFPITQAKYVKGGYIAVADLTARNAIYDTIRATGLMVYVISEDRTYRLVSGVTNSNWTLDSNDAYVHTQSVASSSWTINHNLGYRPNVMVTDVSGNALVGQVRYTSEIAAEIAFNKVYSGFAYLS